MSGDRQTGVVVVLGTAACERGKHVMMRDQTRVWKCELCEYQFRNARPGEAA